MILNPGKYHSMSIGKDTHDVFYYDNFTLKNSNEEEILGVTIDRKLTFHQHIKKISIKLLSSNLHVLPKKVTFMSSLLPS